MASSFLAAARTRERDVAYWPSLNAERRPSDLSANSSPAFQAIVTRFNALECTTWFDFDVPTEWLQPEREALFWKCAHRSNNFPLEMALASAKLRELLEQNRYLLAGRFTSWPSRDRHQLWATLWLALRFWPERLYSSAEVVAEMERLLVTPDRSVAVAMHAELLRRTVLERMEAPSRREHAEAAELRLCRRQVAFLLDGDKLFALRAAAISHRPWWQLPLNTQFAACPSSDCTSGEPGSQSLRDSWRLVRACGLTCFAS